ncbi:MAG: sigma 54-interacting transcriptional regulator [Deltaproteobacteria bacterium]|nr:sigma 54-interacting transcriptional regulator [Deltaproteobacteria bacterium]
MGVEPSFVDLILDNVADGVFTVDETFRITYFNRAAERITGFSSKEAVGRPCSEVFRTGLCGKDCPLRESLTTGSRVVNFEIDITAKAGKPVSISVSTAPLLGSHGQFIGGVETFRDLTRVRELTRELYRKYTFQDIVSKNPRMRRIFDTLPNVAQTDATVLLLGRSGTGKELFASAIHNLSPRNEGPFVVINCGALPEALLESELFGHTKGAFTDAKKKRVGRFEAARGGTIFLDEIGDTPLSVQVKLLRVLELREFEPLGSDDTVQADVRVIAATNQDLEELVAQGRFREDLFYRLNVVQIRLPDIRERQEDVPLLVEHFLEKLNHRMSKTIRGMSEEALRVLMSYEFPGNVRELENAIERAFIVAKTSRITVDDLPDSIRRGRGPSLGRAQGNGGRALDERSRIVECLQRHRWNIPRSAHELGMHRTTLWRKARKLGLLRPDGAGGV